MSGIWVPNTSINSDANQAPFILKDTASNSTLNSIGNTQSSSSSNTQNINIYSVLTQSLVEIKELKKTLK